MVGKLTISELKKMPRNKKLTVYAGGKIRKVTAGTLLRRKQEVRRKERHKSKN